MTQTLPRPTLLPGLRPLWRDRHTIQLGTDPAQAVVLELPHPVAARVLDLLDGSRTERAIIAEMSRTGLSATDVRTLLTALAEAGLVVAAHTLMPSALPAVQRHRVAAEATALALRFREHPASPAVILHRRYAARVIIAGDGPFARLLAPALLGAGVGTVGLIAEPGDTAAQIHLDPATGHPIWPTPRSRNISSTTDDPPTHLPATKADARADSDSDRRRRGPEAGDRRASETDDGRKPARETGEARRQAHETDDERRLARKTDERRPARETDEARGQAREEGGRPEDAGADGARVGAGDVLSGKDCGTKRERPVRAQEAFVVRIGRMTRVGVRGARTRQPQLAISVRDGVAIVGPLVPPTGGPCLRCLDLHRTDRDPAWPRLAAQLAEQQPEPVASTATMLTATGFAVAEVLSYLDGAQPCTIATTVEINGSRPWRRRSWTPHAGCDCTRRR